MRFLLFLLLGTLLFGFAFPAFILIVGLIALVVLALIFISFFTGAFGGRTVIYTSKRDFDPFAGRQQKEHPADDPEVIGKAAYPEENDAADFGEDAEGEVVELPATALRKEEDEEK